MEKQVEEKGLQLEDLKVSSLPELQGWKEKQEQLVIDNPYVGIIDNKTYELACKSRTNLLKGRTALEGQEKTIASKLAAFRKEIGSKTKELIDISIPHEEKQQTEVKRYEAVLEAKKQEKERLEQERIDKIKDKIDAFETKSYEFIATITFANVDEVGTQINLIANEDFDYEEFDVLFEMAKGRVQIQFDAKFLDVKEKEELRLKNEELEKDNERLRNENLERENKAKSDKEKIFEIRKKRLLELDSELDFSIPTFSFYGYGLDEISNTDAVDFETFITDAKQAIDKDESDKQESENQKAIDLQKSLDDAETLKKENKARVKRFIEDKKTLVCYIEDIQFDCVVPRLENEESKVLFDNLKIKLENFKTELLTELEKL